MLVTSDGSIVFFISVALKILLGIPECFMCARLIVGLVPWLLVFSIHNSLDGALWAASYLEFILANWRGQSLVVAVYLYVFLYFHRGSE